MKHNCLICGKDTGTKIVCDECNLNLTKSQVQKFLRVWHEMVVKRDNCQCVYCGHSAPWESGELCGNHKETHARRIDLRFDLDNGECTCMSCNGTKSYSSPTSMKKERSKEQKQRKAKKLPICKHPGCPIYATTKKGLCWKHDSSK